MAELNGNLDPKQAEQALSPEEQRIFSHIFSAVDNEGLGVVTGDVAIRFLPEKTRLPSEILGEIWQVADPEDKGFVTKAGFFVILRLIGYAQAGRAVSPDLVSRPGPLPRLEGTQLPGPAPLQAQGSGGPIPIPRLSPEKANQYATLFEQSGAQDGVLDGIVAKQIFDRAQLPNDVLIRIWNLADTEQRGKLSVTEFIIAMHLLASFRSGAMRALPNNLPAGLYDAAARRGIPARSPQGSRSELPISAVPRSFTGQSATARVSSPLARQQYSASPTPMQAQPANDWAIPPNEKAVYDQQFARLDVNKTGSIGGEQAVGFFSNSKLSENDLAQVWDLADITQNGQLTQDEFAVAMHLIRQQLNGKGPLPTILPTNLVPPSLRRQIPPTQASVPLPVQAQPPSSPPRSKSALDDLFGLDVNPTTTPKQIPQSTGGSAAAAPSAPTFKSASPPPAAASHFRPFVPSSSFGQSIIAPQATGQSATTPLPQKQASTDDDLLGDADPNENKNFTQDTTDVANLNNQVNTLTTQTRDLQAKKTTVEQEISQSSGQKRDLEQRLSQLRTTYEQEARELRSLQDRLNTSKTDTTKLQQDLVMVQHSFQVLQEQKQQVSAGFEADQKESTSLKERIAQVQKETSQITPQIEKIKADARQQKGLVAIAKKQLSTAEAEREKLKAELEAANLEHSEAKRELDDTHAALEATKAEDSSRSVESHKSTFPPAAAVTAGAVGIAGAAGLAGAAIASPAPSTSSMNPFFRRAQSSSSQGGFAPPAVGSPNHSAFDSFFDNSFGATNEQSAAQNEDPTHPVANASGAPDEKVFDTSREVAEEPEISASAAEHPPSPPRSRQMSPSVLPLRDDTLRAPSADSSLGVVVPESQFGDVSGRTTPTKERALPSGEAISDVPPVPQLQQESLHSSSVDPAQTASTLSPEPKSALNPIPGSFPLDSPTEATNFTPISIDSARDLHSPEETSNGTSNNRSAFDALFGGFGSTDPEGKGKAPAPDLAFGNSGAKQADEFPPIQEFANDDEDSSDDESDDSPRPIGAAGLATNAVSSSHDGNEGLRPGLDRASSTGLPTPNAQSSPPTYDETRAAESTGPRDANQFAAEYAGLLPSREDPTALAHPHSIPNGTADEQSIQTTSVTAIEHPPSITQHQAGDATPIATAKAVVPHDDFDDAFGDLSEAQAAEPNLEDDLTSSHREGFEDFNPTFDSPAPSKAPTIDSSAFQDFESTLSAPNQSSTATGTSVLHKPEQSKDEWDALFEGFGNESSNAQQGTAGTAQTGAQGNKNGFLDAFDVPPASAAASNSLAAPRPDLTRTVTDNEHDDPIVKHLTAMGYSRGVSVEALEKFDYNLDKAANYLASTS